MVSVTYGRPEINEQFPVLFLILGQIPGSADLTNRVGDRRFISCGMRLFHGGQKVILNDDDALTERTSESVIKDCPDSIGRRRSALLHRRAAHT